MPRGLSARTQFSIIVCVLVVTALAAAGMLMDRHDLTRLAVLTFYYFSSWSAPTGATSTEMAEPAEEPTPPARSPVPTASFPVAADWPSYNKTLTSHRYSRLSQIDKSNVHTLTVLCTYDIKQYTSFQTGLIMVNGALIGTTEHDIFSLDPATCKENWRTSESYKSASPLTVNRGAAYLDGRLFRGTQDGRVLAYDFQSGQRLWATAIANPELGETVPAAPIAWNGLVFIGNAGGGAYKGVKGRVYALDARSGDIVWEAYLVPKAGGDPSRGPSAPPLPDTAAATWGNRPGVPISGGATWTSYTLDPESGLLYVPTGNPGPAFAIGVREGENLFTGSVMVLDATSGAYRNHFKIVARDWHDWDVSAAPTIIMTAGGRKVLSLAPKDGHLYGFDLATNKLLYRTAVTRIENADAPFSLQTPTHFCPGTQGGAEWNGPAYDPQTNLILVGEVEWCTTVSLQTSDEVVGTPVGRIWTGSKSLNPFDIFGSPDPRASWAGWLYAVDADTGVWKWRLKSNYPILSGVTPTAGGIVFFGDMGGNFYALDASTGKRLWGRKIGGGIGGGVITYAVDGSQKVAVATGFTSILWPTEVVTAKIVILGLGGAATRQ
jgi:alcohol dehydrogenase (cytochrome c)